jgi:VWFA-related protein
LAILAISAILAIPAALALRGRISIHTMPRRILLACVLVTGALTVLVNAQQTATKEQQQQQQQQPTPFRSGTNLVRVDVSVLDKEGRPVRSLTANDFEIRENGELQSITSFKLVDATGQPTNDFSLPIRSAEHAAAEAARDDVRVFLIFWDEYHIEQFGSAVRAREQLTRFVLDAFGPTDLVGLMDQLTPVDALRFTRDRRELADQVHLLRGRRGIYVPARSAIEEAHLRNAQDVERIRSQVTASALKSAIMHLGAMRQGRKAVVFVSEGLVRLGQDALRIVSDLIRTANDNNTAIYTVDPRGLQAGPGAFGAGMSSLLAALADSTGAESIVSNDMTGALRKVVLNASAFYLLGYSPKDSQFDGRFREIKVRVKQSGFQVRARNGYWAPRGADVERARAIAAAAALPSQVSLAFRELTPDNSRRAADFWIGLAPSLDSGVDLNVAWTPRPGIEGRSAAASVLVMATAGQEKLFEGTVKETGAIFTAPPGTVQLDLTMHDSSGEVIDREQREVTVPDPRKTTLALATPIVSRARNAAEVRALAAESTPTVFAGRDFSRSDRLLLHVTPYGTDAAHAVVSAELVGPRGATLAELPIKSSGSRGSYLLDLPLTNLAAGEFLISVVARTPEERVETFVPIRIGR